MLRKFMVVLLTLLAVLAVLVSGAAAQAGDLVYVRVGHFAGDAPDVDVYLNGELSDIQALTYGDVTPWLAFPAGTYEVAITAAGQPLNTAVATASVELEAGTWATVAAVGSLGEDSLRLQAAVEDYATPIADGVTRFTLFHAMEGMSGVDLVRQGAVLLSTVTFPDAALGNDGAGSVELAAGTFDFQITAAGRTDAVVVDVPELALTDGDYVTVFLYGSLDAPLYSIQTVTAADAGLVATGSAIDTDTVIVDPATLADQPTIADDGAAFVRVGHFGADAPAVDVYLNGELSAVQNLAYGEVTDWVAVPAGEYTVDVTIAGQAGGNPVMSLEAVVLEAGTWATISAVGLLGDDTLRLSAAVEDYDTPIADGYTRVTVFHAITDMSGVDLARSGAVLLSTVTFPDAALGNDGAGSVELESGTFTFQISAAGRTDAVLVDLPETVLEENTYVAIFLYGTLDETLYTVKTVTAAEANLLRRTS